MILAVRILSTESKAYPQCTELKGSYQISSEILLKNVVVTGSKGATPGQQVQVLRVEYDFTITYLAPNAGYLRFGGNVDFRADGDLFALKEKLNEDAPCPEVRGEVMNAIMQNVAPIALLMSKVQGLPPAIPIPVLNFETKKQEEPTYYHG